ncbi:MAG: NADH-quinone oxidoreductase subunit J family protein [Planctomycetota bacterium]
MARQVTFFFWVFAALIAGAGLLAVTRRHAVAAALWAVVVFVGIAGEFVLMQAYFLAVVEVLVYAGAIMVLFLFVIMLLQLGEEDVKLVAKPKLHFVGALVAVAFLGTLVWVARRAGLFEMEFTPAGQAGETANVAVPLFQEYVLPFEVASFLLLSAIVGSVLITKRRLR